LAMGANAREANRLTGERMVTDEVRWLGEKARELLEAYDRERPTQRLRTFAQVEELWEQVVRPELPSFRSMQELREGQEPVREDSVWFPNWRVPGSQWQCVCLLGEDSETIRRLRLYAWRSAFQPWPRRV